MSIPVPLERLRSAIAERGPGAYVLTVSDDGSPHAVHVAVGWDGERLVADVGARTASNAAARATVSILCPVRYEGDYTLIVDGTAAVEGRHVAIAPTRAVLHRPAAVLDPASSCAADCVPLLSPPRR